MERPIECGFLKIGMDKIIKELVRFKEFMDEIGVEFFLVGGLCLGIVRDGALISCDKDFDIAVLDEQSLYKIEKIEKEIFKYYDEVHIVGGTNGKVLWLKKYFGEYVLPIEVAAQYIKGDYLYYNRDLGETWMYREGRCVWNKRLFDIFEKVKFAGTEFNVPSPVNDFLDTFYGDDWRTPKEYTDWRYNCNNLYEGFWK